MTWDGTQIRLRAKTPFTAMLKQNRLDPTLGFFWGVVILHVVLWTILASRTQPNVPFRTLELLSSGRQLAWGYATHPPMGVWVASIASSLAAPRIWPLYLLAQCCGVVSVWAAWILARKFLHPWTALCGAIVLLGGFSCTIAASEFTATHLASAFWSLSILAFHEALTQERRRYWAATGILMALGFLTSYGTFLLLVTMFIFTLWDERARRCWDSSWPFLAGLMMAAVMAPHVLWLASHQFVTIQSKLAPASSVAHHLQQPLAYLGTQLLCLIPVLVLLAPLVGWFSVEEPATGRDEERDFARRYLIWLTCLPPVAVFALSLVAGPSSSIFAGVTNWTYLGIALLLWGHLSETRLSWRRSLIRIGTAVGFFAAAMVATNVMLPHLTRQGMNTHFPGKQLARTVEEAWRNSGYSGNIPVIGGTSLLVKNAAWYAKGSSGIKTYENLTPNPRTGVSDTTIAQNGGVVIWDLNATEQPNMNEFSQRFGQVSLLTPVVLQWNGIADVPEMKIGMAVVHPALAQSTVRPALSNSLNRYNLPAHYPAASSIPTNATSLGLPLTNGAINGMPSSTGVGTGMNNGYSSMPNSTGFPLMNPATPTSFQYPTQSPTILNQPSNPNIGTLANPQNSTGNALKGFSNFSNPQATSTMPPASNSLQQGSSPLSTATGTNWNGSALQPQQGSPSISSPNSNGYSTTPANPGRLGDQYSPLPASSSLPAVNSLPASPYDPFSGSSRTPASSSSGITPNNATGTLNSSGQNSLLPEASPPRGTSPYPASSFPPAETEPAKSSLPQNEPGLWSAGSSTLPGNSLPGSTPPALNGFNFPSGNSSSPPPNSGYSSVPGTPSSSSPSAAPTYNSYPQTLSMPTASDINLTPPSGSLPKSDLPDSSQFGSSIPEAARLPSNSSLPSSTSSGFNFPTAPSGTTGFPSITPTPSRSIPGSGTSYDLPNSSSIGTGSSLKGLTPKQSVEPEPDLFATPKSLGTSGGPSGSTLPEMNGLNSSALPIQKLPGDLSSVPGYPAAPSAGSSSLPSLSLPAANSSASSMNGSSKLDPIQNNPTLPTPAKRLPSLSSPSSLSGATPLEMAPSAGKSTLPAVRDDPSNSAFGLLESFAPPITNSKVPTPAPLTVPNNPTPAAGNDPAPAGLTEN